MMLKYDHCSPLIILTRDKDSKASATYDDKDNLMVDFKLSDRDRKSLKLGMDRALNTLVAAGVHELCTSLYNIEPFKFNDDEESRIDNARLIVWKKKLNDYGIPAKDGAGVSTAHQMGSNHMGISPKVSVCKPSGECWDVDNLYVADASLLPTASDVNPMVTTEALALHVADCILNKYRQAKL